MSTSKCLKHFAYLGLGSNLKQPDKQIKKSIKNIKRLPETKVTAESAMYKTGAIGPNGQKDYLNAVIQIKTGLNPYTLLSKLKKIEKKMGRKKAIRWGSRCIDIDILLYDNLNINDNSLVIPHKEMLNRNFVLVPLREIAPNLILENGQTIKDALITCPKGRIKKLY